MDRPQWRAAGCARSALLERPDWHGVFDPYQTQQPLLERRTAAKRAPDPLLGFANKFGVLTDGQDLTVDTDFGRTLVHGETLQLWQDEIRALSLAVSLWDATSVGGNRLAAELKAALVKTRIAARGPASTPRYL